MTYIHPNDQVYAPERILTAGAVHGEGNTSAIALIDSQAVGNG